MVLLVLGGTVTAAVEILTLTITSLSGYFAFKQRAKSYTQAKDLLIAAHFFFAFFIALEIVKTLIPTVQVIDFYSVLGTLTILAIVEILTLIAWEVHLRNPTQRIQSLPRSIFRKKFSGLIFTLGTGFICYVGFVLVVYHPFHVTRIASIEGISVETNVFSQMFLFLLLGVLFLFMVYPTTLFFLARRKTREREARRALILLPVAWIGIGLDLLFFNGYTIAMGYDALPIAYLLASLGIGATALILRRASLLVAFFQPPTTTGIAPSFPFSKAAGCHPIPEGSSYLLEVNPSMRYEKAIRDLAIEVLSNRYLLFAFTPMGSRIYDMLSGVKGVRFYVLTSTTSYPNGPPESNEMLVPEDDPTILLDTLRKTLSSVTQSGIAVLYDNLSDMILLSGIERSHKFVKRAIEILSGRANVVSIFLLTKGAHDEKVVNLIQNVFHNHIVYDTTGLKLKRSSESAMNLESIEL